MSAWGNGIKASRLAWAAALAVGLTGCGGEEKDDPVATTAVSGTVIDGYIKGATVCVDTDENGQCGAGEPISAASSENGTFLIADVPVDIAATAPLVAVVPASAQDSDDTASDPSATVGRSFVLMTPAGKNVISPLTTLVQSALLDDPSQTPEGAAAAIKSGVTSLAAADLFADYLASGDTTAHDAAKVIANSLKGNYETLTPYVANTNAKQAAVVLSEFAKLALQSQGSAPDSAKIVGVEDSNTLRATLLSRTTDPAAVTQDVTVNFDVVNGGSSIKCGDSINLSNTQLWDHSDDTLIASPASQSTAGTMVDLRFYVSNVLLLDAQGNAVPLEMTEGSYQSENVALLDFGYNTGTLPVVACTSAYNTSIIGKVPAGAYTGISMTIGVPVRTAELDAKLNHTNSADPSSPAPLQVQAMAWTWQGGRKFMKIEFHPDTNVVDKVGAGTANKWNVHLGSVGCSGDPTVAENETACTNPNRLSLKFDAFDAASQKVVLDVAELFKDADVTFEGGGAVGCMSGTTDPECDPIFEALGLSLTNGQTLSGAEAQTVFTVQ